MGHQQAQFGRVGRSCDDPAAEQGFEHGGGQDEKATPDDVQPHHIFGPPRGPSVEDFLTATLNHGNLQVDTTDPSQRPMIAILDAKPGLEDAFRGRIVQLVRAVRREPGCVAFTA